MDLMTKLLIAINFPFVACMNKPAKEFIMKEFEQWYADQLDGSEECDMEDLQLIDLRFLILLGTWIQVVGENVCDNP